MNNIMIDIEALSTEKNALIVSIGAVFFDPKTNTLGKRFYQVIDIEDAGKHLSIDASTVKWWFRQSDAARAVFAEENTLGLEDALIEFYAWIKSNRSKGQCFFWAKSPNFDLTILRNAFTKVNLDTPWAYWQERDVRTVLAFLPHVPTCEKTEDVSVKHNALADAISQAKDTAHVLFHLLHKETADGCA